jgi:hypothetical protein
VAQAALSVAAFAASYIGFALLALRQAPHHAAVIASPRTAPSVATRGQNLWLGTAALGISLGMCLLARGPSFGAISWVLLLATGALGVTFTLTFRPRWLRPLQRGAVAERPRARCVGDDRD